MSEIIEFPIFQGRVEKYNCKCEKLEIYYNKADTRYWTAILNKGKDNIFITHCVNKSELGDNCFDIVCSGKVTLNVEPEDIYETVETLVGKTPNQE
jgi:hypothetical protein